MAKKNNRFVNQMLEIARRNRKNIGADESAKITPAVYASMAIALHREFGFGRDRINRAFATSQDIWADHTYDLEKMVDLCAEETGVKIVYSEELKNEYR